MRNELSCEQRCLLKGAKVVIPEALRTQILELIHEDHIGIVRTKILARSTVWWPNVCQQSQNNPERCLMSWPKWVDIHHMGKCTSLEPTIEILECTFQLWAYLM
nr:unnamed protein product [Callosobruchus analis]